MFNNNHLTVRLAWHDSKWNGCVCKDPKNNGYCNGTHSLLSARIEKEKDASIEDCFKSQSINLITDEKINFQNETFKYQPPCYWSINCFSNSSVDIYHDHPLREKMDLNCKPIKEKLNNHSIFSWPFKLSFNRTAKENLNGKYPKDLEKRIERFQKLFLDSENIENLNSRDFLLKGHEVNNSESKKLIFFYCNYDNPVSANEYNYLLLGCGLLSKIHPATYYDIDQNRLKSIRRKENTKNFPEINWALQYSFDPEKYILLPYHEYLDELNSVNSDKDKTTLQEMIDNMKVTVTENSLISGFKYVAMNIDDDKSLFLLYKLKKSLEIIREHNIIEYDFDKVESTIDDFLTSLWKQRGLYPGLQSIIMNLLSIGTPEQKYKKAKIIVNTLKNFSKNENILDLFEEWVNNPDEIPNDVDDETKRSFLGFQQNEIINQFMPSLRVLSLFNLNFQQIRSIFNQQNLIENLENNPYILVEEYISSDEAFSDPFIFDEPIELFKIDLGLFPDFDYTFNRDKNLQIYSQNSPQRLRALIIECLKSQEFQGNCYHDSKQVIDYITDYPIFYKKYKDDQTNLRFNLSIIRIPEFNIREVFEEKIFVQTINDVTFYQLLHVKAAEEIVSDAVNYLVNGHDIEKKYFSENELLSKLKSDSEELSEKAPFGFDKNEFIRERINLLKSVFSKKFFVITGKPGSGKTYALKEIVSILEKNGETFQLLAPTGKAALRLSNETGKEARTIDYFINKFRFKHFKTEKDIIHYNDKNLTSDQTEFHNIIVDECSMIDVIKLSLLLLYIGYDNRNFKRLVLVGDPYQLPPIGFGMPFNDIIKFINPNLKDNFCLNFIRLSVNCRIKDQNIINFAELFANQMTNQNNNKNYIQNNQDYNSDGLLINYYENKSEIPLLIDKYVNHIEDIINLEHQEDAPTKLNNLYNFKTYSYPDFEHNEAYQELKLERFQILTPYRSEFEGTLLLNNLINTNYRKNHWIQFPDFKPFHHAEKIICIKNWYEAGNLKLANGSIGIVNSTKRTDSDNFVKFYIFPSAQKYMFKLNDEENYELAYAITVHKSQGSDFEFVILILPENKALLSRELVYTAITRSKNKLFVIVNNKDKDLLMKIQSKTALNRLTSIFEEKIPQNIVFSPEKGVLVDSKVEFIIYKELLSSTDANFIFTHAHQHGYLEVPDSKYGLWPDFKIECNGKTYYWEHLGLLNRDWYKKRWAEKIEGYKALNLYDNLITTDDLAGICAEKVKTIIENIKADNVINSEENYSKHHYSLR